MTDTQFHIAKPYQVCVIQDGNISFLDGLKRKFVKGYAQELKF
jgi:hypothetical protein